MSWAKYALRRAVVARARWRDRRLARRPHHELAVCAIFREEAPFLDEWLAFHAGIGVTQFYLYDNFSTDGFRAVVQPWIARGLVTLRDWPHPVGQLPAYRHCLKHHWQDARWIAFIDVDEFLFAPGCTDIRPILREYGDVPGLLVYSLFFGASGYEARPKGPVTAAYTWRAAPEVALSGKSIANPRLVRAVGNVHLFRYWDGETLDTARRTHEAGQATPVLDRLRLNHYWSRSIADLHTKVARGDASTPQPRDLAWHLDYEARLNAVEDQTILPVAEAIRASTRDGT